ncbi:MAG: carotenoid 1,2-hydratase [Candidatus Kapabacteria bacterium]|nr:carotenoid 1,2-hydratase [Ignavibacteriota bacterium]MCW5884348.1 carotenoid 1,2-hydratase [Candidatus Kapabacteria bacterium]
MKKVLFIILFVTLFGISIYFIFDVPKSEDSKYFSVTSAMSAEGDTLFKKAILPVDFQFPRDHAAHNDYKLEWWYFTGNLQDEKGNRFGYQFTIFRNALSPEVGEINSNLSSNQLYFAHFALTDVGSNKHYYFEKFSRGIEGLAGTDTLPLKIFIENWTINGDYPNNNYDKPIFRINAVEGDIALNLYLEPVKNMVLHGDRGLSAKSYEPGNASYYYSFTRIKSSGNIEIEDKNYSVTGSSWMDREWSTSALSAGQTGWDWFSVQLDNNIELMFFRLRDSSGATNFAKGTLVLPDGTYKNLKEGDFQLKILNTQKLESGTEYPTKWRIILPEYSLEIISEVQILEQEMKLSVKYYEGSIRISGRFEENPIAGYGYVELTGY